MATLFNINSRVLNGTDFGLRFPDQVYSAALAADTDTTLTIPSNRSVGSIGENVNKFIAVFKYESPDDTFVRLGATADQPAGAAFAVNGSELAPPAREVNAGDVIHFRSIAGGDVTVSLYSL